MTRLVKAADLATQLGISRRAMRRLCKEEPQLAVIQHGAYFIRLEEVAKLPGWDLVSALMLPTARWIKATDLARFANRPRRTIAKWCLTRPRFARRLRRVWYIDMEALDATDEQILGLLGNNETKEVV